MRALTPLTLIGRVVRSAKPATALGRCPVCSDQVLEGSPALHLHGMHVHRRCASYRMRQRERFDRARR